MASHAGITLIPWLAVLSKFVLKKGGNLRKCGTLGSFPFLLIWLIGYLASAAACSARGKDFWLASVSAVFTMIVLAGSSAEDIETQSFYVLPLLVSIGVNLIMAALSDGLREVDGPYSVPLWVEIALVTVILIGLRIGRLAIGDCGIYLTSYLSFLTLCRENSFLAFFLMLLVSTVLGIFTWVFRLLQKKDPKERFPYTAQISAGCAASYFVFCFLPYVI